jgi:hypothetical protein
VVEGLEPAGGNSNLEGAGSEDRENKREGACPGSDAPEGGSLELEDLTVAEVVGDTQIGQVGEGSHWSRWARHNEDQKGSCSPVGEEVGRSPRHDGPAWEVE